MRAIIFDFDGTILETDYAMYKAWQSVYDYFEIEFPFDRWLTRVGRVEENFDILAYLMQQACTDIKADMVMAMQQRLLAYELNKLQAREGVQTWIEDAKSHGMKLAIASNSSLNWIIKHLKQVNLLDQFDVIVCRDHVEKLKPAPDVYQAALQQLNTYETDTVAIEDSPSGVTAAHAAGLHCMIIPSVMTHTMRFPNAIYRASSLAQISLANFIEYRKHNGFSQTGAKIKKTLS